MPTLKPDTIWPTPEEDAAITAAACADDDAQPITQAQWAHIAPTVRRGLSVPTSGAQQRESVTLNLDADLLAWYRAQGSPWQQRMQAVLAAHRDACSV